MSDKRTNCIDSDTVSNHDTDTTQHPVSTQHPGATQRPVSTHDTVSTQHPGANQDTDTGANQDRVIRRSVTNDDLSFLSVRRKPSILLGLSSPQPTRRTLSGGLSGRQNLTSEANDSSDDDDYSGSFQNKRLLSPRITSRDRISLTSGYEFTRDSNGDSKCDSYRDFMCDSSRVSNRDSVPRSARESPPHWARKFPKGSRESAPQSESKYGDDSSERERSERERSGRERSGREQAGREQAGREQAERERSERERSERRSFSDMLRKVVRWGFFFKRSSTIIPATQ
jgi:hypothetical protein